MKRLILLAFILIGCSEDKGPLGTDSDPKIEPFCEFSTVLQYDFGSGEVKSEGYYCTNADGSECEAIVSVSDPSIYETNCRGLYVE